MKTNTSANRWLIIVSVAGLAAAYAFFLFLPGQEAIARLRQELADQAEFIGQVEAFGSAIEATQQEFDKTRNYVEAWERSAPSEEELSGLFGRINQLARDAGATTTRFEPEAALPFEKIRRIPVVMVCVGSFGQICEFLQHLEGLEETIWIEDLRMERVGEDGEDVRCELTMAIFADNPDNSDQVDQSE